MLLLGCKPEGRFTEQHDIFFGVAEEVKELKDHIISFWPEAKGKIHVDAWREVKHTEGYNVNIVSAGTNVGNARLFFINLGGYKRNEFDEFHYKLLIPAKDSGEAVRKAKQSAFYKHTQFDNATSHIDDKYGIDVDDVYEINDILLPAFKEKYSIQLTAAENAPEDEMQLGYLKLDKL
jgi:hypothetical protein